METRTVDAVDEFRASRILGPDGNPFITNGFSRERIDTSGVKYMSAQRISRLVESPAHYAWKYIKGNSEPDTPAKRLGRLTHWALLQPKEFLSRYVIQPTFSGTGMKAAKAEWESNLNKNAIVMTTDQAEKINHMIQALRSDQHASKLLSKGTPELHTFYADHEFKDELNRPFLWYGIMDFFRSGNWIVEVKTTRSARLKDIIRDSYDNGYHLQTWKYRRMVHGITGQMPMVVIIAVENVPPYSVQMFEPKPLWWEQANYETTLALESFKECSLSGHWHAYSKSPQPLNGPLPWQKSRFESDEGET